MLRHSADRRSMAFLALAAALPILQWNMEGFSWPLFVLQCFMFVTVAVMSHNHNHLSFWKSRPLNLVTSWVISIHYGVPAIAWVPTHNQNHHHYNNREGDSGRSPGLFRKNHLLALVSYPTYTGIQQQSDIANFMKGLWRKDRRAFWMAASEYLVFFGFMIAVFLLDWKKALLFYFVPQQISLFAVQTFNYVQHVEADTESKWNHSRNFVSPILNALLFNNGFHTVHHQKPGVHWSQTPALHEQIKHNIDPSLLVKSYWAYMIWTFLLRPLVPGAGPKVWTRDEPASEVGSRAVA